MTNNPGIQPTTDGVMIFAVKAMMICAYHRPYSALSDEQTSMSGKCLLGGTCTHAGDEKLMVHWVRMQATKLAMHCGDRLCCESHS